MNQFLEIIQQSYNAVFLWAEFAFSPVQGAADLLAAADSKELRQNTAKIWIVSITLSIILILPVLHIFDIGWQNVDFLLSYVTILLIMHIFAVYTIHFGLWTFNLKSNIVETSAIYTIMFVYLPLVSLASLPNTYRIYFAIREIKHEGLAMADAIPRYLAIMESFENQQFLYYLGEINTALIVCGMLFAMVAFNETICAWYGHPRHRTYLVVSPSIFIAITLAGLVGIPILLLVLYSYIK